MCIGSHFAKEFQLVSSSDFRNGQLGSACQIASSARLSSPNSSLDSSLTFTFRLITRNYKKRSLEVSLWVKSLYEVARSSLWVKSLSHVSRSSLLVKCPGQVSVSSLPQYAEGGLNKTLRPGDGTYAG